MRRDGLGRLQEQLLAWYPGAWQCQNPLLVGFPTCAKWSLWNTWEMVNMRHNWRVFSCSKSGKIWFRIRITVFQLLLHLAIKWDFFAVLMCILESQSKNHTKSIKGLKLIILRVVSFLPARMCPAIYFKLLIKKKTFSRHFLLFLNFNLAKYMYIILQQNIYISNFIVMTLMTTGFAGFCFFRRQKREFLFIYFQPCEEPGENSIYALDSKLKLSKV